jgi:hypothetical protein
MVRRGRLGDGRQSARVGWGSSYPSPSEVVKARAGRQNRRGGAGGGDNSQSAWMGWGSTNPSPLARSSKRVDGLARTEVEVRDGVMAGAAGHVGARALPNPSHRRGLGKSATDGGRGVASDCRRRGERC